MTVTMIKKELVKLNGKQVRISNECQIIEGLLVIKTEQKAMNNNCDYKYFSWVVEGVMISNGVDFGKGKWGMSFKDITKIEVIA